MNRVYEKDTDDIFLRTLRSSAEFARVFLEKSLGIDQASVVKVRGQTKHKRSAGSIDIEIYGKDGLVVLVENKIDAGYSITKTGEGQVDRYRESVSILRDSGANAFSVLVAPQIYLNTSKAASEFDGKIAYEELRPCLEGEDLDVLERAIEQAATPYEPIANLATMDFFEDLKGFAIERFPTLVIKANPNAGGVRPEASRTIYFDVSKTLVVHDHLPRPRMSLQCWDSGAPSASIKIMIGGWGPYARLLSQPESLDDIGGYLRPAGRSLGIVIDSPRLNTQARFIDQIDLVSDGLEAGLRLQGWWKENRKVLEEWDQVVNRELAS